MNNNRNAHPIWITVFALGLIFQAIFVSGPGLINEIVGDLDFVSILIIAIGATLFCAIIAVGVLNVRFNLRRQKFVQNGEDNLLAISPVWGWKIRRAIVRKNLRSPVIAFGERFMHVIDVSLGQPLPIDIDYKELGEVYFSTKNVPPETAGYVHFVLRGVKFKLLLWSPTGSNNVGLKPMLPASERDRLYAAIHPRS